MGSANVLRVVLDPNVLISALIAPGGVPAKVVAAWRAGAFALVASDELLAELDRALGYPKLARRIQAAERNAFVAGIRHHAIVVNEAPPESRQRLTPDPADDYLVMLARAGKAEFLVSGDADLTELESSIPPVLTPREFLELLRKRGGEHEDG